MVGFVLEERYVVEGSRSMWLNTHVYGGRQPHTMLLMRFFEKIAWEASKNETKQLKSNPEESNEH